MMLAHITSRRGAKYLVGGILITVILITVTTCSFYAYRFLSATHQEFTSEDGIVLAGWISHRAFSESISYVRISVGSQRSDVEEVYDGNPKLWIRVSDESIDEDITLALHDIDYEIIDTYFTNEGRGHCGSLAAEECITYRWRGILIDVMDDRIVGARVFATRVRDYAVYYRVENSTNWLRHPLSHEQAVEVFGTPAELRRSFVR